MSDKKTYDIIKQFHGYEAMKHGWHEKSYAIVTGSTAEFPTDDYSVIELPLCFWRVRKSEIEKDEFRKYLARTIEHQQKNIAANLKGV